MNPETDNLLLKKVCGGLTAGLGICAAVLSLKFGFEVFSEQPMVEYARNINDAERTLSILGLMASSVITSAGLMLTADSSHNSKL